MVAPAPLHEHQLWDDEAGRVITLMRRTTGALPSGYSNPRAVHADAVNGPKPVQRRFASYVTASELVLWCNF